MPNPAPTSTITTARQSATNAGHSTGPIAAGDAWVDEIEAARSRLAPYLHPTPLVESATLSHALGRRVFLKLESQQPAGAFKVRPAFNSILANLQGCRNKGVVTNSSGNFAQAVAYAATCLGVQATIVMMDGASAFKRVRTQRFGGDIVLCANSFSARFETTERIQRESGRLLVHPFNSRETIAGNGTLGQELIEQTAEEFTVLAPISGGGLIAGIALGVKSARPGCRILGVQAAANPSMKLSLERGHPTATQPKASLADALTVPKPGSNTFPVIQRLVDDVILVSEVAMADAIRALAVDQKLVVEAGGAVSVAAAMAGTVPRGDSPIICIVSGGNIAPLQLSAILSANPPVGRQAQAQPRTVAPGPCGASRPES